jgi:cellulose synthase/poly-beta-1,6-N-acetylglucosamine synthase-like glycosyltransferase
MAWVFWASAALLVHGWIGYLAVLVTWEALARLAGEARSLSGAPIFGRAPPDSLPPVSLVVAAHDEEACIGAKVSQSLALDYPSELFELIVGDDGSVDRTADVAREAGGAHVQVWSAPRTGKAGVLNRTVPLARGEIVVLTDANTRLEPGALRALVKRFEDPRVGAVCGHLRLEPSGIGGEQEGLYWRLESLLKLYEGRRGMVVGANGGIYAVRKALFEPLPEGTVVDDFVIPMRILARGFRVEFDPEAVAYEETAGSAAREFKRRVRISAGNFRALPVLRAALSPASGRCAFAFWSHKVLRWVTPALLLLVALSSALLASTHPLYALALLLQGAFYGLALLGGSAPGPLQRVGPAVRYFVEMNAALAVGFWRFLRGTQAVAWERAARRA